MAPVFALGHTLRVSLCEGRFVLESGDRKGELCHWVQVIGATVDELFDEFRDFRASSPFCREVSDLLFARNFAGEEEPEET